MNANNQGTVYMLHFDRPISDTHTSQHYIGWAKNLEARIKHHRAGTGANFCRVAKERGIGFQVVATWPGDKNFERKLKNRGHGPCLCPVCADTAKAKKAAYDKIRYDARKAAKRAAGN